MPPSFRERQQQVREQAILESAFELLTRKGYTAMTMDDVAAAVGISKATLYQHFSSKEELTVSVAVTIVGQIEEYLRSLDPRIPAIQRLEGAMRWIIAKRFAVEERAMQGSAGGLGATIRPVARHDPRFRAQQEKVIRALSDLVDAAKADGDVTAATPTRVIVQAMLGLMRDLDYAELLESAAVTGDSLGDSLTAIFLNGIRIP